MADGFEEELASGFGSGFGRGIRTGENNRREDRLQSQFEHQQMEDLQDMIMKFDDIADLPIAMRPAVVDTMKLQWRSTTGAEMPTTYVDILLGGNDEIIRNIGSGLANLMSDVDLGFDPTELLAGQTDPGEARLLMTEAIKLSDGRRARDIFGSIDTSSDEGLGAGVDALAEGGFTEDANRVSGIRSRRAGQELSEAGDPMVQALASLQADGILVGKSLGDLSPAQLNRVRREAEQIDVSLSAQKEGAQVSARGEAAQDVPLKPEIASTMGVPIGTTPRHMSEAIMLRGDDLKDFQTRRLAIENFIAISNDTLDIVRRDGAAVLGVGGGAVRLLNNVAAQFQGITDIIAGSVEDQSQLTDSEGSILDPDTYSEFFDQMGVDSYQVRANIVNMIFAAASMSGQTGRAVIEADLIRFAREIGATATDPQAFISVLSNFQNRATAEWNRYKEGKIGQSANMLNPELREETPGADGLTVSEREELEERRRRRNQ